MHINTTDPHKLHTVITGVTSGRLTGGKMSSRHNPNTYVLGLSPNGLALVLGTGLIVGSSEDPKGPNAFSFAG